MQEETKTISVEEFASLAGVKATTVRRWIKEGVISAKKEASRGLLKTWRIDPKEIEKIKK